MEDELIGKGSTTLDYLRARHEWLGVLIDKAASELKRLHDENEILSAAITAAELRGAKAMQEAAVKLCEDEFVMRKKRGEAHERDESHHEASAQHHKAITANALASAIRAIDPATVGGGG